MQNGLVKVFNRSLKFGARIIQTKGKDFRSGILDLLASFRCTSPENDASTSELLFGWKIRSDSDIRNPYLLFKWEVEAAALSMEERREIVEKKYAK